MHKRLVPLALAFVATFGLALAPWLAETFTFQPESRLWVEGTSTVHDWTCEAEAFTGNLQAVATDADLSSLAGTTVEVAVPGIDCDSGTMNGKVQDALEADDHPRIAFTLTRADVGEQGADGWFVIDATGKLTIAGTTRPVQMDVRGKALGGGRFQLAGQAPVRMTDFGVDPPTAMLGTLKTGDDVTVHFDTIVGR